jgi:CHAT domain-containing protein/tetratricopeptide (TPR) repeat protein
MPPILALAVVLLSGNVIPAPASKSTIATRFQKSRNLYHSLSNFSDRQAAVDSTTRLIGEAHAAGDTMAWAALLAARGANKWHLGRPDEATADLEFALELADAAGDTASALNALYNLGAIALELGRPDEATALTERRLAMTIASGAGYPEALARTYIAYIALETGELQRARRQYELAIAGMENHAPAGVHPSQLIGLGRVYWRLGEADSAKLFWANALEIAEEKNQLYEQSHALNNLATFEFFYGDLAKVARYYGRVAQIDSVTGDPSGWIIHSANRATLLMELGRFSEAESVLVHTAQFCWRLGFTHRLAGVIAEQGWLELARTRPIAAADHFRRSIAAAEASGNFEPGESHYGLAFALLKSDSLRAAVEVADEAISRGPSHTDRQLLRVVLCNALRRIGDVQRAAAVAEAAASDGASQSHSARYAVVLCELASCHAALGHSDSTDAIARRALDAFATHRQKTGEVSWREVLAEQYNARAVDAASLLLHHPASIRSDVRIRNAFDSLQRLKTQSLQDRIMGERPDAERTILFDGQPAIDLAQLQHGVLQSGEVLLDFSSGVDSTYLFVVTRLGCRTKTFANKDLEVRIQMFRENISRPLASRSFEITSKQGLALGQWLFGSFADLIQSAERLLIVPDGWLNAVPFAALTVAARDKIEQRPLVDVVEMHLVPSATVLAWLRRSQPDPNPPPSKVLALTDAARADLPGSIAETRHLQRAFREVDVLSDFPSGPGVSFEQMADGYDVVHLAAHVEINTEKPWQCGVRLGKERFIRAAEVARGRFRTRLAVLSGCESAGGRAVAGEGVLGLTAAFVAAGVPATVSTLWPVDDRATETFVSVFYNHLADGETVSASLRGAQRELRLLDDMRHPFFWAAFVIVGDGGIKVHLARRAQTRLQYLGIIPLIVIVFLLARRFFS